MLACAPVSTPMVHFVYLIVDKGIKLNEQKAFTFRRLIGRLIYLTNTRSNIAFSINSLSQFVFAPTTEHKQ